MDFTTGVIINKTTGKTYQSEPFPEFMRKIIASGGLVKYTSEKLAE